VCLLLMLLPFQKAENNSANYYGEKRATEDKGGKARQLAAPHHH